MPKEGKLLRDVLKRLNQEPAPLTGGGDTSTALGKYRKRTKTRYVQVLFLSCPGGGPDYETKFFRSLCDYSQDYDYFSMAVNCLLAFQHGFSFSFMKIHTTKKFKTLSILLNNIFWSCLAPVNNKYRTYEGCDVWYDIREISLGVTNAIFLVNVNIAYFGHPFLCKSEPTSSLSQDKLPTTQGMTTLMRSS